MSSVMRDLAPDIVRQRLLIEGRFFAVVLFTCKAFDANAALDFTRSFFSARDLEHRQF